MDSACCLSSLLGWGGRKKCQEKNDNTFFCSSESKAEAASLNAVGLVLCLCKWGRALFPSRRHCNQIYGCSSALPQRDAVVWSSARSSWKQAEGEQLTRAGGGCSLEGAFFALKLSSACEIPAAAQGRFRRGSELPLGWREEARPSGCSFCWERPPAWLGAKARLCQPSGTAPAVPMEQVLCCCPCLHRAEGMCPLAEWNKWKYWVLRGRGSKTLLT